MVHRGFGLDFDGTERIFLIDADLSPNSEGRCRLYAEPCTRICHVAVTVSLK
jgi:hypothetical protein